MRTTIKKTLPTILAVLMLVAVLLISCTKDKIKINCSGEKPYYCEEDEVCCKYKYYDRHGTCWSTMSGCRSTGYACVVCHIQD